MLDRLLQAIRDARPGGAGVSAWSVCAVEQRRMSLGTRDGETGNVHTPLSISESVGARYLFVWDDGLVSRGSLEKRQILVDADETVTSARATAYDDPDAASVAGPARFPDLALYHDPVAHLLDGRTEPYERRLGVVRDRVRSGGFATWSGTMWAGTARTRLVTSAGLDVEESSTSAGWHVSLDGEWGDGHGGRTVEPDDEYDRRLDRLTETVALLRRPGRTMAPGVHPVLLHPHVVDSFVLGTLLHNLTGASVAHGEGQFGRDDFGSSRPALREDVELRLDPLQPERSGSYRFTSEGVPAAACAFVERGCLVTPVLDLKFARRLGLEPTPVPQSRDTLSFRGGSLLSLEEAWSRAAGGALVLSVLGVHTQDPASGDFSLSAPQILRIGPGGLEGRLRGTLSGNLFEVLRDDGLEWVEFQGETTPGLLFPCRLDPTPDP